MITLDYADKRPLYEQTKEKLRELIITGILKPHDKIPSVRELASSLSINPNTIQKAYRELESRGYFYSVSGLGNFVAAPSDKQDNSARINELKDTFKTALNELVYLECPKEEIMDILKESALMREGETKI